MRGDTEQHAESDRRVLGVVLGAEVAPYADVIQRRSGLSPHEFKASVDRLVQRGDLTEYSAPLGHVLYPSFRLMDAARPRRAAP